MTEQRIQNLIDSGILPPGWDINNPQPDFPYTGDILSAKDFRKIGRVDRLTIPEIEEYLENTAKQSGRYYFYPGDKNKAGGIKIPFEISQVEPTAEEPTEPTALKAVRLEMEVKFLERENKSLTDHVKKLEEEVKTLKERAGEQTVFNQFIELQKLQATGAGQVAGIEKLMDSFSKGQEVGTGASAKTIELLEQRIRQLEKEKADLSADYEEQIEELEEELETYRKRVGEMPDASEDITTKAANVFLDIFKDKMNDGQKALPAGSGPEDQITSVVRDFLLNKLSIEEAAAQIKEVVAKVGGTMKTMLSVANPSMIASFVYDQLISKGIIRGDLNEEKVNGVKTILHKLAEEVKK